VQVGPIKPKLKPPVSKRLKLKSDILLSTSAFKLNLRRYSEASERKATARADDYAQETQRLRGRGLHSFSFQLNLSSSVHHIT